MGKVIDMTGKTFGRLTVVARAANRGYGVMWLCRCSCGTESNVHGSALRRRKTVSCGCFSVEQKKSKAYDLTGKKFGRLTAIERADRPGRPRWRCTCSCGDSTVVIVSNLCSGQTTSCGCYHNEFTREVGYRNRTHGRSRNDPAYQAWRGMRNRCTNPASDDYPNYGGRGIKVCTRWSSFEAFATDMGPRPDGLSLDRIDNDGNYEPDNCRWATPRQQARNRRVNLMLTFRGETKCLTEWAEILEINTSTLRGRLRRGWDTNQMLTTPVKKRR